MQTNGYLLECSGDYLLIDAPEGIAGWLANKGVKVTDLLLTHQHYDHVMDVALLQAQGVRVHAYAPYSQELTLEQPARAWGMPIVVSPYVVDELFDLEAGCVLRDMAFKLSHIPGHAKDSVTFYHEASGVVFSGDTLFAGSVGRTDLPGGNTKQLMDGIQKHLLSLPGATRVLSGHGPETSISREIVHNPFF